MTKYIIFTLCYSQLLFSSDFTKLGNINIYPSDIPDISTDHYLKSNEFLNNIYGNLLKNKPGGTLISVGTIRALIVFGLAAPDYGIFLDSDKQITEYNKSILNLISSLSKLGFNTKQQRYLFIGLLSFDWLSYEELKTLEQYDEEYVISYVGKKEKFLLSEKLLEMPPQIRSIMQSVLVVAENSLNSEKYSLDSNDKYYDFFDDFNCVLEDYFSHRLSENDYKLFFEDDTQWEFIVNAINNNRILIINSDLSSINNFKIISSCLRTLDAPVKWIDISNIAENYMHYLSESAKDTFLNIIVPMLPIEPKAQLLFTHRKKPQYLPNECVYYGRQKCGTDGLAPWCYYSLPLIEIMFFREIP